MNLMYLIYQGPLVPLLSDLGYVLEGPFVDEQWLRWALVV